jgi:hypothetical protein
MRLFVRLLVPVAGVLVLACSDDNVGPRGRVSRAEINGYYECIQALGWVSGRPENASYFRAGCAGYKTLTSPDRTDSAETFPFTITGTDRLRREDFQDEGVVQFDSTTATITVQFPASPVEEYLAVYVGQQLQLIRQVPAFDYTGDEVPDSLELYFLKKQQPATVP